jgi:hypothetical protein
MSFTLVLAILALLSLGIVFGVANKIKGLKFAILTTGIALVVIAMLYVAIIYAIVSRM